MELKEPPWPGAHNQLAICPSSSLHGWRIWSHLTAFRFFSLFAYEFRIWVYLTFFYIIPVMNSASREGCDTLTK